MSLKITKTIMIKFFRGYANLFTPVFYYQFLCLRYSSRRNPYTRNLFHELRMLLEKTAYKPGMPQFVRQALLTVVSVACKLAPNVHVQEN